MSSKPLDINTYAAAELADDQPADGKTRSDGKPERRAHERYAIDLPGRLSRDGEQFSDCNIRDFCLDGMMLVLDDSADGKHVVAGEAVIAGESLLLQFSARINAEERDHVARVNVARIGTESIGVSFDGENAEAVWQLRQLASQLKDDLRKSLEQARSARAPCAPMPVEQAVNAGEMLDAARSKTEEYLKSGMVALFKHAEDKLIAGTQQATTDTGKTDALDALKEIDEIRVAVETAYLDASGRDFDKMVNPDQAIEPEALPGAQELALVDTGSFDDWVTTKNMISSAEARLREVQFKLEKRLTYLVRSPIDEENNPLGLSQICLTFHDALQGLGASGAARRAILESFEHAVVKGLATFYDDVNAMLSDGGILPGVERDNQILKSPEQRQAQQESEPPESELALEPDEDAPEEGEDTSPASVSRTPTMLPPLRLGTAFHAAGNLIAMQRNAEAEAGPGGGEFVQGLSTWSPARPTLEQQKDLLESLSILQRSPRFAESSDEGPLLLSQKLTSAWRSAGLEAGADHHMMLDIVSNLVDAIMDDPFVSDEVKVRVRRLAVPILKVAFQDPSFFEDQAHPARQVVDNLGRLDPESTERFAETVDPVVNSIIEGYEDDPSVFARALTALKGVVSRQRSAFQQNLEQLVSERERQQEFVKSRQSEAGATEASKPDKAEHPQESNASGLDSEWEGWLNEARRCKPGDVLSIEDQTGKRQKLSLAWVSEDKGTFILVDTLGRKAMSLTTQELAMHMKRGSAVAEDIANMALTDRGTYRMLRSLHEQLARKASHDQLTDLLTRKEFEGRLDELITDAVRSASCHVMFVIDIEGLPEIVNKAGKKVAAQLLKKLAQLLEKQNTGRGVVGRLGTSRFGVLIEDANLEDGREALERQRRTVAKVRCMWKGETFPLTTNAAILEITDMSEGVDAMIKAAGAALERAAKAGGDRVEETGTVHDPIKALGLNCAGKTTVLDMLNLDSLKLRCQRVVPVSGAEDALPHFEILLGVQKDEGLVALPTDFIRAAERNHEMQTVDRWVIKSVFGWINEHQEKLDTVDGFSINLSSNSLSDEGVLEFVLTQFSETMVPPAKIIFEFPESAATANVSLTTDFVSTLKTYGCRFAIDDFGMADSSFSYLNSLAVDFVKIDGKLVADILASPKDLAVVRSINEIGHLLGKQTIAEFVENDDILSRIRELGVDYAQGYGIERPTLLEAL